MDLKREYDNLTNKSCVGEIQAYVHNMIIERGFEKEDAKDVMILLTEEIGELAKAIRKTTGLKMDISKDNDKYDVKGEIADVFNYLLSMCDVLDVDLFEVWKKKEQKNFERTWK